jgi:putative ABC transport system permease protein
VFLFNQALERFFADLRFAWRQILRNLSFSFVIILTLALGIGAVTAVYQVADQALFHPLPYPEANRIVMLWGRDRLKPEQRNLVSAAELRGFEENNTFSAIGGIDLKQLSFALTGAGRPRQIAAANVTPAFFEVLGEGAEIGSSLRREELSRDANSIVVVSHNLWREVLHSDPQAIGKTINLDGRAYKVIAVMPSTFHFPIRYQNEELDAWMPSSIDPMLNRPGLRVAGTLLTFAKLSTGTGLAPTQQQMNAVEGRLISTYPEMSKNRAVDVFSLKEELAGAHHEELLLLLGAVGVLLIIACFNVANLLITRGHARSQELATRISLGAGRASLLRQLLTESLLLAFLGVVCGIPIALLGSRALASYLQTEPGGTGFAHLLSSPALASHGLPLQSLAFLILVFGGTLVLSGTLPAFVLSARNKMHVVNGQMRMSLGNQSRNLRLTLMIVQIALALPLAVSALLLVRSFERLVHADPVFQVRHRLTYQITLPMASYPSPAVQARLFGSLLTKVHALAGVESAGLIGGLPLTSWMKIGEFQPDTLPATQNSDLPRAQTRSTSPEYFVVMGIPVLQGRIFEPGSEEFTPKEVVISRSLAAQYWPASNPIGHTLKLGSDDEDTPYTVVGVVGDVHQNTLEKSTGPEFYLSFHGHPDRSMGLVVNTTVDPKTMQVSVENALHSLNPELPIAHTASFDELVQEASGAQRVHLFLLTLVAALAVVLTAIGVFGLVSYFVTQRTREIGIRIALGAGRSRIFSVVAREILLLLGIGVGGGLGIALGFSGLLKHLLFGVSAFDPAMYASASLLVVACALLASVFPLVRAFHIETASILNVE